MVILNEVTVVLQPDAEDLLDACRKNDWELVEGLVESGAFADGARSQVVFDDCVDYRDLLQCYKLFTTGWQNTTSVCMHTWKD